jgi:Uma2 family endonuclease
MAHGFDRRLDYSDLVVTPDDGKRYELARGVLIVTPSPKPLHQRVSKRLLRLLMDHFETRSLGEVFDAPTDLILTAHDVFVPDLLVVADPSHVTERGIEGPPLLVVEILSPSTAKQDRFLKPQRYAELGVAHYWIVDPEEQRIECYRRAGNAFQLVVHGEGTSTLTHPDWDELTVDLAALWR